MRNTITEGDCLEAMKDIPDGVVDMILCDLPYGVTQNKKDLILDLDNLWSQYKRVAKPNAAFVLTAQFPFSFDLYESNRKWFKYDLIWDKEIPSGHLNARRMPLRVHEHILIFYGRQPKYNPQYTEGKPSHGWKSTGALVPDQNYGDYSRVDYEASTKKHPRSIVRFAKPHASVARHRTEKSVDLFEWLIRTYTDTGELVLDNCCGSGTTGVACVNTGREYILIDNDPECVAMTRSRL